MDELITSFFVMLSLFIEQNITLFIVSMIFIALDILSGCIAGFFNHNFSSTELRKGLGHKIAYIFLMCAVAVLQVAMFDPNFSINFDFPLFNIVCAAIIFMEFISIIENLCAINPNIDNIIGKYFNKNKDNDTVNIIQQFNDEFNDLV